MTALGPHFARCHASAVELIVGIVHLIDAEDSLQTTFIKSLVVSYEREPGYLGFYLLPYDREDWSFFSISGAEAAIPFNDYCTSSCNTPVRA